MQELLPVLLIRWEIPRLRRGGGQSLTYSEVTFRSAGKRPLTRRRMAATLSPRRGRS